MILLYVVKKLLCFGRDKMVSVIIPVYNVEKYIRECVDSVIKQTYRDIEIILVDDGSTDSSGILCDEYAKNDLRIKVIHKQNGGLSSARNAGIEIATGDYLTFVDSDDYIALDMLEQLMYAIEHFDADFVACGITSSVDKLDKNMMKDVLLYTKGETLKFILKEKKIVTSACGKLYSKELFERIRYPYGMLYEDFGTTYKLVDISKRIVFVDVKKYYYRCNFGSITKSKFSDKHLDYYKISEELYTFIDNKYPQLVKYVRNHSVRMSIAFMRRISILSFEDKNIVDFLVKDIRDSFVRYLFSGYAVLSKIYGLLICISPQLALKIFKKKRK